MATPKCNRRLEELAIPKKRIMLSLYNEYAERFDKDKADRLKLLIQELYPMTPEQTEKYFLDLKTKTEAILLRRQLRREDDKKLRHKRYLQKRDKAYRKFKRMLRTFIGMAYRFEISPLISLRLRFLSDIVFAKLCAVVDLFVPNRADPNIGDYEKFLLRISDWIAVNLNYFYYYMDLENKAS